MDGGKYIKNLISMLSPEAQEARKAIQEANRFAEKSGDVLGNPRRPLSFNLREMKKANNEAEYLDMKNRLDARAKAREDLVADTASKVSEAERYKIADDSFGPLSDELRARYDEIMQELLGRGYKELGTSKFSHRISELDASGGLKDPNVMVDLPSAVKAHEADPGLMERNLDWTDNNRRAWKNRISKQAILPPGSDLRPGGSEMIVLKGGKDTLKAAAPLAAASLENPIDMLSDAASKYEDVKKKIASKVVDATDFARLTPEEKKRQAEGLSMVADPVNLVDGPAGWGLTLMQMLAK